MAFSRKNKNLFKTIIAAVLGVALVFGCVALVGSLVGDKDNDLKTINADFEVGGLTDSGKYNETKLSIYTKENFKCQGLKITLDFDSNVQYQAFFYDENDGYIEKSLQYAEGHTFDVPETAIYARLVVTPLWDSDVEEKDKELNIFNIRKYEKQLKMPRKIRI